MCQDSEGHRHAKDVSSPRSIPDLTSGRLLARNTIWNVLGQLSPLAVGVLAIPPIVRGLGLARFGVLSLAWVAIGYFSFFDLGVGRAVTKLVAEKLGAGDEQAIPPLVWTSLLLMALLGGVGGAVLLSFSPWLVQHVLQIPTELQVESLRSFYLLALSLPLITLTSGLRAVLEALQCFRVSNLIRIPLSAFSFAGPLLVLPFSRNLVWIVAVLILGRIAGCIAHLLACLQVMPALRHSLVAKSSLIKPMLIFGGWMTVSNVISPVLVYVDRFVLSSTIPVSTVAFYTAPFDMVVRLMLIPGAVAGVLFPAFASSFNQARERTEHLLNRSLEYVFLVIFPITLVVVVLAPEILRIWLGPSFAQNSSAVLRWLAMGVLVNSLAHTPFALVQSANRPDLTAKLHLIELPLYLCGVWWLTANLGVEGTAVAWTGRLILDTLLVGTLVKRVFRLRSILPRLGGLMFAGMALLYLGALPRNLLVKMSCLGIAMIGLGLIAWFLVLGRDARVLLAWGRGN